MDVDVSGTRILILSIRSGAQHRVASATAACDTVRAKIQREEGFLKAARWKAQNAIKKFKEAKNEADILTTKKKVAEAAVANAQAERCRLACSSACLCLLLCCGRQMNRPV
jgi:hypothetical protein